MFRTTPEQDRELRRIAYEENITANDVLREALKKVIRERGAKSGYIPPRP